MYHRGTLAEFDTWHTAAKISDGIPDEGKIGYVKGVLAPLNQRTMAYSVPVEHPVNADDCIWCYGKYPDTEKTVLSQEAATTAGWEFELEA